eukprot:TRINITY_DN63479_c0_g1_i1.p1 TRINITY_DN63479_c0_g1~~TRINITY_DN63479_c0_g1_i1.p1  ORF type:complete len:587 (-),score=90.52 TRINITY_DN63479_c0_g1_i1:158-1918(-)
MARNEIDPQTDPANTVLSRDRENEHRSHVAGSAISELLCLLQGHVERLHDAIYVLPRQHAISCSAQANGSSTAVPTVSYEGYAQDLTNNGRRFVEIVRTLPFDIRRNSQLSGHRGHSGAVGSGNISSTFCDACSDEEVDEDELEALKQEDALLSEAAAFWHERSSDLQQAVDDEIRQTCGEICGANILHPTFRRDVTDSAPFSSDNWRRHHGVPSSGSTSIPIDRDSAAVCDARLRSLAGEHVACPRLQDLVSDKSHRFVAELEFLQCLANPEYVQWLANQRLFEAPAFLKFLAYLRYWAEQPHVQHVVYPQGLRMLEMLMCPEFRARVHRLDARTVLTKQMLCHWVSRPELPILSRSGSAANCDAADVPIKSERRRRPDVAGVDPCHLASASGGRPRQVTSETVGDSKNSALERQSDLVTFCAKAEAIGWQYLAGKLSGNQLDHVFRTYKYIWSASPASLLDNSVGLLDALNKEQVEPVLSDPRRDRTIEELDASLDMLKRLCPATFRTGAQLGITASGKSAVAANAQLAASSSSRIAGGARKRPRCDEQVADDAQLGFYFQSSGKRHRVDCSCPQCCRRRKAET